MSIQAVAWAIDQKTGSAAGKVVLLCLANYADEEGKCWPSQETIAAETELSERSVREWLQKLEEVGLLSREKRRRDDGYRASDLIRLAFKNQPAKSAGKVQSHRQLAPTLPEPVAAPTSFEPSKEPSAAAARKKSDFDVLSDKLLEAVGDGNIQGHGALVIGPIIGLIEAGCDLETDILPTIRAVSSRLKRPAGSWSYFIAPIREAYEARLAAGRGVAKPPTPEETEKRWHTRLKAARRRGQWSTAEWGPAPGQPGSIVPNHLLQPGDGEGWREWQSEAA